MKYKIYNFLFSLFYFTNVDSSQILFTQSNRAISAFHGYVEFPRSRAVLCRENINKNCGSVGTEPQSVEGMRGFPRKGPKDGQLASGGGRFRQLDEYGLGRWTYEHIFPFHVNETHVKLDIFWIITAMHVTKDFRLFLPNENFRTDAPLSRSMFNLNPVCIWKLQNPSASSIEHTCYIDNKSLITHRDVSLYAVWDIGNNLNAFYQVLDVNILPVPFPTSALRLYHGYVQSPRSRSLLCHERVNKNCGLVAAEPQSIEGKGGFPFKGPPDGKLASGGKSLFKQLNEYGPDRWIYETVHIFYVNQTHAELNIKWLMTASHYTLDFKLFLPNQNYKKDAPLSRNMFDLEKVYSWSRSSDSNVIEHTLHIPIKDLILQKDVSLFAVWDIADTPNAFYQVIDVRFQLVSYKSKVTGYDIQPHKGCENQCRGDCYDLEECLENPPFGFINKCDCHAYFVCAPGWAYGQMLTCPSNLVFDETVRVCNWPDLTEVDEDVICDYSKPASSQKDEL